MITRIAPKGIMYLPNGVGIKNVPPKPKIKLTIPPINKPLHMSIIPSDSY